MRAAIQHDAREMARIARLQASGLLDSPEEPVFKHLVSTTAALFDAPITAVSLVDEDRQWFKSSVGLAAKETPRSMSFCSVAIAKGDVLVVENAQRDARFKSNELVTGAPYIRAYAGVPVHNAEGDYYGALCVIDTRPREFNESDLELLNELGDVANRALVACEKGENLRQIETLIDKVLIGSSLN